MALASTLSSFDSTLDDTTSDCSDVLVAYKFQKPQLHSVVKSRVYSTTYFDILYLSVTNLNIGGA